MTVNSCGIIVWLTVGCWFSVMQSIWSEVRPTKVTSELLCEVTINDGLISILCFSLINFLFISILVDHARTSLSNISILCNLLCCWEIQCGAINRLRMLQVKGEHLALSTDLQWWHPSSNFYQKKKKKTDQPTCDDGIHPFCSLWSENHCK